MTIRNTLIPVLILTAGTAAAHGPELHKDEQKAPTAAGHAVHGAEIGEPGDPKKVAITFRILMGDDMKFHPTAVTVRQGQTVKFIVRNAGKLKHEMVLGTKAELEEHAKLMEKNPEMEHDDPNAVSVEPGKTGNLLWKFAKVGEVDFACLIPGHMQGGMVGKVVVNP